MAAATRKRPAETFSFCPAAAGKKKRARYEFGSIYNYQKLEVLGEGTYGVVVKARDQRTGETVAVKWIRTDDETGATDLRAVYREAGCLEACRGHPSIVQMKEVAADEVTGHVFIVMEFVGPSLHSRLTRPFSEGETRAFMRQLLRGAEKLHGAGTIHRDIKPDNVLVGPGGALKICDLGMAVPARPAGEPYPEETVAALWYRAPELLTRGSRTYYGPAVDMWALGCVMAELLIGEPLFKGAKTEDDMLHRARDLESVMESTDLAFEDLSDLSEAGREVLRGLLRFVPEKRLTAAEALSHRWFDEEDVPPLSPALCPQKNKRGFVSYL
ncbi:putative cyclin-dependent kinase F-2 [Dichanthelium oligosanthes]|uniref:[RNA-polymerase]-subunit kinase n=1 Tax=Dichanthelium oligosanthes TaxID=888268 RepID=A0A1E5WK87_9POAL|nr:putative cyclin-dependent kinase F-2 [Dichanthelium oligosanthes]